MDSANEYDHMTVALGEFDKLNRLQINVGITNNQDEFLQMIAIVNNDGTTIFAKNVPYLVIPVKQPDGKIGYIKKKSVSIPARRFLEQTIIDNEDSWQDYMESSIINITNGSSSAESIMDKLGQIVVNEMKSEMTNWKTPPNAPLTVANKGKNDPLIDKGTLRNSITYEVVEKQL